MARQFTVLTAVGPDRPGIVQAISTQLHRAGANLEDSRMAILGGEFALLALIGGEPEVLEQVQKDSRALGEELGLELMFKATGRPHESRDYLVYELRVTALDRPGIVHTVTDALASRDVNVAALETKVSYAPLSGTPMFVLQARLQVPSAVTVSELRKLLAALADTENFDFVLSGAS